MIEIRGVEITRVNCIFLAAAAAAKLENNDLEGGNFQLRKKSMINW